MSGSVSRVSFDQLSYRRIPIWENRHRAKVLDRFRDLLTDFNNGLKRFLFVDAPELAETHRSISELKGVVSDMCRLAGISFVVPESKREYLAAKSKWLAIPAGYDLLDNFFWLVPGLRKDVIELVDRAKGVYDHNKGAAWRRTFNPFYWFGIAVDWIAGILLRTLADFGVEDAAEPNSRVSRIVRRVVYVLLVVVPAIMAYLEFFGLREVK